MRLRALWPVKSPAGARSQKPWACATTENHASLGHTTAPNDHQTTVKGIEVNIRENQETKALVDPAWVAAHSNDPNVCLIEVAGLGQDNLQAYKTGHVPGAHPWKWKDMLWETHMRDFPSPEEFARRLGAAGIDNNTTVVFYGEGVQFGIYAWWVFRYCGHENVRILDGARHQWAEEGRPLVTDVPPPRPVKKYEPVARVESMRILCGDVLKSLGQPQ